MILLNKPKYLTSFQTIQKFQRENPKYADCKLGYVGTLDPMATGLLIVLENEENKQRKNYIGLTKTYEFEILFGINTDSYDLLGLVNQIDTNYKEKIENLNLEQFEGKYEQKYPLFSAKIVNGKRLYNLARKNQITEQELPSYERNIISIQKISENKISKTEIINNVKTATETVVGDFGQQNILNSWLEQNAKMNDYYITVKLVAVVSSGTYIRRLCVDIAKKYNTYALAYSINRTKVGDFDVKNSI